MKTTRKYRKLWLLPLLFLLLAELAAVIAWPHLSDQMPTHWDIFGEPTNLARKGLAVAALPVAMLWTGGILGSVLWSTTRMSYGPSPTWVPPVGTAAMVGLLLIGHLTIIANGLGWPVSVPKVTHVDIGLLIIGLGWMMQQIPPNAAIGIRTPRTLSDPAASERANRMTVVAARAAFRA